MLFYKSRDIKGIIFDIDGTIIDSLLYYNAPGWLFTIIYAAFAITVIITFIIVPPTRKDRSIKSIYRLAASSKQEKKNTFLL